MRYALSIKTIACLFIFTALCPTLYGQDATKGLKDYYASYFPIGVAVSLAVITGAEKDLILTNFNSLTAENVMKMGPIHPKEDQYNWEPADQIVDFAIANKMKVRGHTLVWHNQTPDWLFKNADGSQVDKETLLKRMKEHITQVVSRYKGKIYAWDVVNEAIDDEASKFYRDSPWYQICGEEFIAKAFQYAHEADPDALLFYNDYNTEKLSKRDNIYKLVKQLLDAKVPIHGVGLQGHWSIYEPSEQALRESLKKFSSLGVALQITELDVSVYPSEQGRREKRTDESDKFTAEMEQKQIEKYKMAFSVFREFKSSITGITFWNVTDKRSWLDNFPVRGRKNYPLLFDQQMLPKKAYWEVVKF
jgi:endo-1,4-beta-xylanase